MKSTKDYADILRFAIKLQIDCVEEEMEQEERYLEKTYMEGIRRGLQIALEKIDSSAFLME